MQYHLVFHDIITEQAGSKKIIATRPVYDLHFNSLKEAQVVAILGDSRDYEVVESCYHGQTVYITENVAKAREGV